MKVEVVFALPDRQALLVVRVGPGASVGEAIALSGIGELFPDETLDTLPVGIWGRPATRDDPVHDGDRIEIYRPLAMDPRDARRALASAGGTMGPPKNG